MLGRHLCAPYIVIRNSFQKRLHAPKGRHLEPPICGGAPGVAASENGSQKTAPGSGKRLPSRSYVEPFFRRLWWLLWLDMLGLTPWGGSRSRQDVAAPRAGPELAQSCGSQNMTPGGGPQSPGVIPRTSLVQCWF